MTFPNPEAQVFSRDFYLYNHLEGEHAREDVVKIPQDLQDTHVAGERLRGCPRPCTLPPASRDMRACTRIPTHFHLRTKL